MMRSPLTISLLALCGLGCADQTKPPDRQEPAPVGKRQTAAVVLKKPIGIATAGEQFTELVKPGQRLPLTVSETFTNKTDGGPKVSVNLSQKDETGVETIAALIIPIPQVPDNSLQITVTLKVSEDKKLTVKTTVSESGQVKEFGPFPVE